MSRVLAKVKRVFKRQPILWLGLFLAIIVTGFIFTLQPAAAAPDLISFTTIANGVIWAFTNILLALARLGMSVMVFFLQLFIQLAAYNNFIDAPPVVIGWLMVRDVANMFFVVALLVIAFGTILGLEQYEWKKTLMKLILAAIFINFSKLILQLVIDVAHVFTTTFLNAIVATAGGNLISMFHLDQVLNLTPRSGPGSVVQGEDLRLDLLAGGFMAVIFSIMALVIIGAYLAVMLIRMVVLWVLIILSPLAFIAQVLPNTKSYAEEYWKEFTHHVIVAPVMVFFLWLTFATLGSGDIASVVAPNLAPADAQALASQSDLPLSSTISLSEATTWENFASFLIALGFLYVGLDRVQKLGVKGGGIVSGAVGFGKKVAAIATGYAAGRYLYEGAAGLAKKGIKGALYNAPIIGGKRWEQRFQNQWLAWKGAYNEAGQKFTDKGERLRVQGEAKQLALDVAKGKLSPDVLTQRREQLISDKKAIEKRRDDELAKKAGGKEYNEHLIEDANTEIGNLDDDIAQYTDANDEVNQGLKYDTQRQAELKQEVKDAEEAMTKELASPIIGRLARSGIKTEKRLEKTKKDAETRRLLLWKRVGADAGGYKYLGGLGTRGILGTGVLGEEKVGLYEAMDRRKRGELQAEEMRSKAKDQEFEGLGKLEVLSKARLKFDVNTNELKYEVGSGLVAQRIMQHTLAAETHQSVEKTQQAESRLRLVRGGGKLSTVPGGFHEYEKKHSLASVVESTLKAEEEGATEEGLQEIYEKANEANFEMSELERESRRLEEELKESQQLPQPITLQTHQRQQAIQARQGDIVKEIAHRKQDIGYQYATAVSQKAAALRKKRTPHNSLVNDAEQREVWGRIGFVTQNQAHDEGAEALQKILKPTTVNTYTDQVGDVFGKLMEKYASGDRITDNDKENAVALVLKRAAEGGWIGDDTMSGFLKDKNSTTAKFFSEVLGVQNNSMTRSNVRDVVIAAATGGNQDFIRDNVVISEFQDFALSPQGLGLNTEDEFYDKLEKGSFNAGEQKRLSDYFIQRQEDDLRTVTPELQATVDELLKNSTGQRQARLDDYWKTIHQNQPAFNIAAGMREQQIANGHAEASGQTLQTKVRGEILAMPAGPGRAAAAWQRDAKKTGGRVRSKFTAHTQSKILSQAADQVIILRDEEGTRLALGAVTDHIIYKDTGDREKNVTIGLGGLNEEPIDFQATDGVFEFAALRRKNGLDSSALQEMSAAHQTAFQRATNDDERRMILTHYTTRDNVSIALANGGRNMALMRLGEGGGVGAVEAFRDGQMNARFMRVDGKSKHYTHYDDYVRDYNAGWFNFALDEEGKNIRTDFITDLKDLVKPKLQLPISEIPTPGTASPGGGGPAPQPPRAAPRRPRGGGAPPPPPSGPQPPPPPTTGQPQTPPGGPRTPGYDPYTDDDGDS